MGILLLLFVAYQLWGTGIAYSKAQDQAKNEFLERLGASGQTGGKSVEEEFSEENLGGVIPPDLGLTTGSTTGSTTVPTTLATTTTPAPSTVPGAPVEPTAVPTTTVQTAPPATVTTLPEVRAGRTKMRRPVPGKVLGRMVIPKMKKDLLFVEGAGVEDLKTGPGHYAKTPLPGEEGNVGIACHRTTYGAPCFNLHFLKPGDPIFFQTDYGKFRYEVEGHTIVGPKDKVVLAPTPGQSVLTITTCHPQYSAAQRYVVRARLVGTAVDTDLYFLPEPVVTVPPTTAPPTTLAPLVLDTATAIEDPTVDDSAAIVDDSAAIVDDSAAIVDDTSPTDSTDVAGSVVDDATPGSLESERAGSGRIVSVGWFSGRVSYWRSTGLWVGICAAIWIAAWLVARRRRWLGQAVIYSVGFVLVFLPALYFCFENLAHLLPENV